MATNTKSAKQSLTFSHKLFYGAFNYFRGFKADPNCCAEEVTSGNFKHQCSKPSGFGVDKAFCKEHANKRSKS